MTFPMIGTLLVWGGVGAITAALYLMLVRRAVRRLLQRQSVDLCDWGMMLGRGGLLGGVLLGATLDCLLAAVVLLGSFILTRNTLLARANCSIDRAAAQQANG